MPSHATASRCLDFLTSQSPTLKEGRHLSTVVLTPRIDDRGTKVAAEKTYSLVVAVLFPRTSFPIAKTFWQHTGEGISSRRAEVFHEAFIKGHLVVNPASQHPTTSEIHAVALTNPSHISKGPQRYRKRSANNSSHAPNGKVTTEGTPPETFKDHVQFVEERFGRNLDPKLAENAKFAIRRRIAGALIADLDLHETLEKVEVTGHERGVPGFSVDHVYLYPSGMSSIFNTHRILLKCRGEMKSICFGFVFHGTLPRFRY